MGLDSALPISHWSVREWGLNPPAPDSMKTVPLLGIIMRSWISVHPSKAEPFR
jgi:hypothetical protein